MKNAVSIFLLVLSQMAACFAASTAFAAQPELTKTIQKTKICSNMDLIDQAPALDIALAKSIDHIVVSKSRRLMYLLNQNHVVKTYNVTFGFGASDGPKMQSGDGRTPEGMYSIKSKNPQSKYHLSLKISYPEKSDIDFAKKNKLNPGSDIMIHGFPSRPIDGLIPDVVRETHPSANWTQGCIGVTDHEIEEIFSLVVNQVPIEICPLINEPQT